MTLHHIIFDGWSKPLFNREVTILYRAFRDGKPSPLSELPLQYADYAVWQRQWLQGEVLQQQLTYWKDRLAGLQHLELPTDRPRPPVQRHNGARQPLEIPTDLAGRLQELGRRKGRRCSWFCWRPSKRCWGDMLGRPTSLWGRPSPGAADASWKGWSAFSSTRWFCAPICRETFLLRRYWGG